MSRQPGIAAKLMRHPVSGDEVVMLRLTETDAALDLSLYHKTAEDLASALKSLLREARHGAVPGDGTAAVGTVLLPAGTRLEFTMFPDPGASQTALEIVVTAPQGEIFTGVLRTPGERSLFIGELSRCARLARLRAGK